MPDLFFAPGVWREECVQSDHAFDAIICAYTGFLWARDGWTVPEDFSAEAALQGWIWVPPEPPDQAKTDARNHGKTDALLPRRQRGSI
jgi:hypothetical protein